MPFVTVRVVASCLLLLVLTNALAEKKIYACKDAAGNAIFSSQPCGPDAKELRLNAGGPISSATGSAEGAQSASTTPGTPSPGSNANPDISDRVADSNCRNDATRNAVFPSDDHLKELETQRLALIKNIAGGANDGNTQSRSLDFQIDEERNHLMNAKLRADAAYQAALAECDKRKR